MEKTEKNLKLDKKITFRLPEPEYTTIQNMASTQGTTISDVMREVSQNFWQKNN